MSDRGALRIFYVDDDKDIRQIVKLSLALDATIDLRSCPGGAEALEALDTDPWRPDVVLLDVMMPKIDGPTLMGMMRSQAGLTATPFIFLTARAREADVQGYYDAGAAGVILKPFDPLTLGARIRDVMKSARGAG